MYTYEINNEAAVAVTPGGVAEEWHAMRGTSLTKDCGQATGVWIRVTEVEDGWKFTLTGFGQGQTGSEVQ